MYNIVTCCKSSDNLLDLYSHRGICSNEEDDPIKDYLEPIMEDLARAYLHIVEKQVGKRKEFFGLRDFYR